MTSLPPSKYFPPVELADPEGLLCLGGSLQTEWLLDAYRHGIFPWPFSEEFPHVAWWSPDPRAIFELDEFHISQRLRRTLRSNKYRVTCNRDFAGVMQGCATAQDRNRATWITPEMYEAYLELHRQGYAYSVESWHQEKLVGGVYGVAIGGMFAGESMFYTQRDASKVALAHLVRHLRTRGFVLLDIQQLTEHTERLGAKEIDRAAYLERLTQAVHLPITFGNRLTSDEEFY